MQRVNKKFLKIILNEIKLNPKVTEKELAKKYFYSERTIRRYIKILRDNGDIRLINPGKNRSWKIIS